MEAPDLLQLKRLAIFATVVEQGSFAKAARYLSMSRSGVSEQVSLLEEALGVRLLQRTTRQIALTREGELVYPKATRMLQSMGQINELLNQEKPAGRVRITTTQDFFIQWLNLRLAQFREKYPDIYFDLIVADDELDLVANQIDLAIRVGFLADESVIARPLFKEQPVITASSAYLERYGVPETVEDLQQCEWVLLNQLNIGNRVTLQNQQEESASFVPERYHMCDSPLSMRHMIVRGLGIGMHLSCMIQEELADKRLQILLPEWMGPVFTFSLVYPSRRQVPLRTRCLIDFLLANPNAV